MNIVQVFILDSPFLFSLHDDIISLGLFTATFTAQKVDLLGLNLFLVIAILNVLIILLLFDVFHFFELIDSYLDQPLVFPNALNFFIGGAQFGFVESSQVENAVEKLGSVVGFNSPLLELQAILFDEERTDKLGNCSSNIDLTLPRFIRIELIFKWGHFNSI